MALRTICIAGLLALMTIHTHAQVGAADGMTELDKVPAKDSGPCLIADPTGTPLNVRTAPYGKIIETVLNGTRVSVIDRTIDKTGKLWVYIADDTGKPIGWVYKNYITCR